MDTPQSKQSRDTPPGTPAIFVIKKKKGANNHPFLKHWQEITKDNLEL